MTIQEERLGVVFSSERLSNLGAQLDDLKLPKVPYDITLSDMETLLAYHANMLPYLIANKEIVDSEEKALSTRIELKKSQVANEIVRVNSGIKATELKNLVNVNPEVQSMNEELLNIRHTQAKLSARISALESQNVSLRKLTTVRLESLKQGV